MEEPKTASTKGGATPWLIVSAWIVTIVNSFAWLNLMAGDRGDGFGDIGFLMMSFVTIPLVFLLGVTPALVRYSRAADAPGNLRGLLFGSLPFALVLIELIVIWNR